MFTPEPMWAQLGHAQAALSPRPPWLHVTFRVQHIDRQQVAVPRGITRRQQRLVVMQPQVPPQPEDGGGGAMRSHARERSLGGRWRGGRHGCPDGFLGLAMHVHVV